MKHQPYNCLIQIPTAGLGVVNILPSTSLMINTCAIEQPTVLSRQRYEASTDRISTAKGGSMMSSMDDSTTVSVSMSDRFGGRSSDSKGNMMP